MVNPFFSPNLTREENRMKRYTLRRKEDGINPRPIIHYQSELNKAQYGVVNTLQGPVLVIAGAGSGKTRTLVFRVARLIETGISPECILLLTFTRRAAQEMLQRASLLLDSRCERVQGGTFHSVANQLLRQYGTRVGIDQNFVIMDRSDSEDAIQLLRNQGGFHEKSKRFPRKKTICDIFSKTVNKMITVEEVLATGYDQFLDYCGELEVLYQEFSLYKQKNMLLDYDDLLIQFKNLLVQDEFTRKHLWSRYQYIMVDEYQDTNRIQGDIIFLLGEGHRNVMVVGDDSQSIYSFRGACFRNIMDFPKQFPDAQILTLDENYRSSQPILDLTNQINRQASERDSKELWTQKVGGALPVLIQAPTEKDQSRFICQKVLELREEGVPLHEMAVLFRSSYHSFDLEIELLRSNIPFEKRGGFKLLESQHVKDLLAHLRVLANPKDSVSWNRLLLLVEGIGPKKCQKNISKVSLSLSPMEIPEYLRNVSEEMGIASQLRVLLQMFQEVSVNPMTPGELLGPLFAYYLPILKQHHDNYPKRMKDLEHLYAMAEKYGNLLEFLTDMTLELPEGPVAGIEPDNPDQERFILSTIHSAKGLEWNTVFIIWLLDGRFPSHYSFLTEEELEEERRLLYVASTRAKSQLFLTYPINIYDKITGALLSKPSCFIDEIPKDFLDQWILDEES
jgi:DNA helicase-2/ATP-dependent DNA helicase PcrA